MNNTIHLFTATAAIAIAMQSLTAQTTASIVADKDAGLYQSTTGTLANGGGTILFAGMTGQPARRRTLLHFDVAGAIPPGSQLLSAQLELNVLSSMVPVATAHVLTQDWSEGTTVAPGGQGSGGAAQAGDATWLHTVYPTSFWNTPGGDFQAAPSFTLNLTIGASVSQPLPGLIADVQSWVDAPATNFGWILIGDEVSPGSASRIRSRESSNASQQPRLVVSYLTPGEVGTWGTGCPVGNSLMSLAASGTASGNAVIPFNYTSAPASSIGATFFAIGLNPSGVALYPSCSAYLPIGGVIVSGNAFVTDANGNGADSFSVPAGFPGFLISGQGAVIDGTVNVFALSNATTLLTN